MKYRTISVGIVPFLITALLCLNFFIKPAACPMECAAAGQSMLVGDHCSGHCPMAGPHHEMRRMLQGMCCKDGMCHIGNCSAVPSRSNRTATTYLQQRAVASITPFSTQPFRAYKTDPAFFLLGTEKDRPPEFS